MNTAVTDQADLSANIVIGKITRPHGIRGALKVEPYTNNQELFGSLTSFTIVGKDREPKLCHIKRIQYSGNQIIVTADEINDRNEAESLRNCYLEIPRDSAAIDNDDSYYYDELIGFKVITIDNKEIGLLHDVLDNPANDIFVVLKDDKELLIPAVDEFITQIDKVAGVITINPIEGLLEYN